MAETPKTPEKDNEDLTDSTAESMLGPNPFVGLRFNDLAQSALGVWGAALKNPASLLSHYGTFLKGIASLSEQPGAAKGDKRFAHPEWESNPAWRALKQYYLHWSRSLVGLADALEIDPKERERARFALNLIADSLSPTNMLLGNPEALRKTLEANGSNLTAGLSNFISDLTRNGGMPAQVDKSAFDVGRNLAITPGAVVFRNEVLELIQYTPTTEEVQARPHMFIPPQINKFYVFDLSPDKSLIKYLLDKGFQVFLVSWRNPSANNRDWDVSTYVKALQEAIAAVKSITGSPDIISHAACSGAMTSVVLAAVLAAHKDRSIAAMTLMVAVLGTEADTALGMFATPEVIEEAKKQVAEKGVLEGSEMGRVFAWMRPNDLIWNYWINNYLLGNKPPAFDILYWNNDTTRLAAKFHAQLLDILGQGLLLRPNVVEIDGTPVDISKINADKFVLAGTTDHITPWRSVYQMAKALGGTNEFVLSSSGHIQSLVNPPGNPRAKFNTGDGLPATADAWLKGSAPHQGSWWEHWAKWLEARSGDRVTAPKELGNETYKVRAAAPGSYVHG